MLRAIFQMKKPVRHEFLEALYRLTEGNPFFVEEVLKLLLTAGDIFFTGGIWDRKPLIELHIPRSIYDAVQQRISLLSEAARETLALAAVVGPRSSESHEGYKRVPMFTVHVSGFDIATS